MKLERHRFFRADGVWLHADDFTARWPGREPERTGTMFAVFFPDVPALELRTRVAAYRYVDVHESLKPMGAWLSGGHWRLEQALRGMGLPVEY